MLPEGPRPGRTVGSGADGALCIFAAVPNGWEPQPLPPPYRVMLVATATAHYFDATDSERDEVCLPRFRQMIGEWEELGARPVGSFVDDLFQVGATDEPYWSFYLIFEVDSLDVAAQMMQAARQTVGGVRMDTWVKLSLRIGRAFFAREETVPRQTVDVHGRS
jgi:hypothetical protein